MKLENQVCSLYQGKRLKELRVSGETLFSWFGNEKILNLDRTQDGMELNRWVFVSSTIPVNNMQEEHRQDINQETPICPAYTVSELGVMLPTGYDTMRVTDVRYEVWRGYDDTGNDCPSSDCFNTEAEARASMLIYLLENGHVTAEEVNNRLTA